MADFNKYNILINYFLIIILINFVNITNATSKRISPVLIEDDVTRKSHRPAECQFGKTLKEIGSTWYADLGPPFGVMYCIKCECLAVTKKRRIIARVQCKNIKNDCPKITCEEPVQLPGKCCKICPGDDFDSDMVQDATPSIEEEERNMKHYGALLTARTSQFLKREDIKPSMYSTNNPLNIVATGRFTFHKRSLYYSFYTSDKTVRPRAIQFIDGTGHILEEQSLLIPINGPFSIYQNSTGKICGVWRRISRDYRKLLREEMLNVVLLWGGKFQAEFALAGQITKFPALSTELFSSLLEPAPDTSTEEMSGAGGTAIVSTSSGSTSSIHMTLVLNGLFYNDEIQDVPLNVRLELLDKRQIILEDIIKVKKPAYDYNIIEFSSPVSTHDLRLLTRGKLILTVESRKRPSTLRIQGSVLTRVSCELFQTLLTSHNSDSETRTSGLAWMYLNKDGSLVYNLQTDDLNLNENPLITLIDDSAKRKTELEDLTPSLQVNMAIGVIDKLGPRVLEPLYSDNLAINVATVNDASLVRGRLIARQIADSRDSLEPILLKRLDTLTPAHSIGMAWISVDNECTLHYEVTISSNNYNHKSQIFEIYLEDVPFEAPGAPRTRKILGEFTGHYTENFVIGLSNDELSKLETSVCYLDVVVKDGNVTMVRGKLKSTKVPNNCLTTTDNQDNNIADVNHNYNNDHQIITHETKCFHYGRFYEEGDQFKGLDICTMCSCSLSRVKCEPVKCPPLPCRIDEIRSRDGECCPFCLSDTLYMNLNNTSQRGCQLGDQFHLPGSIWHPYLPPNGYDTCAVCTCDPISLEINCPRVQCPSLNCTEKYAYRPDKKACCKKCPEIKIPNIDTELASDQPSRKGSIQSAGEILANGGCKVAQIIYENGQEWHPVLPSHGEQKCIRCRCKNHEIECTRKRCTRSICNNRNGSKRRLTNNYQHHHNNNDVIDECCSAQCKRSRRHQNQKRFHRGENGGGGGGGGGTGEKQVTGSNNKS